MSLTPVQKELGKVAIDFRRLKILLGLSYCWAGAIIGALLLLFLDRKIGLHMAHALQALMLLTFLGAAFVFWRCSRVQIALREIARQIERDDPQLNTLLLAALEQQPDLSTGDLNFLQRRVIREAIAANKKSPWNERIIRRLHWAQALQLLLLCLMAGIFIADAIALRGGKSFLSARTENLEITPGNTSIEKGHSLAISARFPEVPSGEVRLLLQDASGGERELPMARSLSDPLFGITLPDVREKTAYRIVYGSGEKSDRYTIDVFEYPELKRADAELKFPSYTGFNPSKIEDTRRVSAVQGTDVHYSFYLNKPVRSARLRGTNGTDIVLTQLGTNAVSYIADFPLRHSGQYSLELIDDAGRTNQVPPRFLFVALENQRPKLTLKSPRGDQRVSALEEVNFQAHVEDDFGVSAYGLAYTITGKETEFIDGVRDSGATAPAAKAREPRSYSWMLPLEKLSAQPGELISYYLWADDIGPDGKPRRSESDIYFAEVRPFEEIFREGGGANSQQNNQGQQGQSPATKLLELQKQILTATWNLQRGQPSPPATPGPQFKKDAEVVRDSQRTAWQQGQELKENLRDDKSRAIANTATSAMDDSLKQLTEAANKNTPKPLPTALDAERSAYQALLKLQAHEYSVSRQRSRSGQQAGQSQQRAQQQLDQLELKEDENRYEKESEAAPLKSPEQREAVQVLSRLKELAQRQQDMSERMQELQSALNAAKTPDEKEKLERMLKRLQEEQQQIVQDMDEVRQRMAQPENQSRMAEARKKLDETRQQTREAAEQLQKRDLSQALSSSSRAQQSLEKLSDEFRKETSSRFAEDMRRLRQEARDLEKRQDEIAQKFNEVSRENQPRTLSGTGPRQDLQNALAQQQAALTNVLHDVQQITEQAESAEPLLSKQLYDTLRKASQEKPDQMLEAASQLLKRNRLAEAQAAGEQTDKTIEDLKKGIERAATSVLGDEAESLRFAEKELRDLADRVQRELQRANAAASSTNRDKNTGTNGLALNASSPFGTNQTGISGLDSTNRQGLGPSMAGTNSLPGSAGQNQSATNTPSLAQAQSGQRPGQPGQQPSQPSGNGDGESSEQANGQNSQGQSGQSRQSQQQARNSRSGQGNRGQSGQENQSEGQSGQGDAQQPSIAQNGSRRNSGALTAGALREILNQMSGGPDGGGFGGGGNIGPLTGRDFTAWSDRLRDLEAVLQDPELRTRVAQIRERASAMRREFKHNAAEPKWNLVESQIVTPLRALQDRVSDELARLASREAVVPVDRDPVPPNYSELVSRYYERLGKD